MRGIDARLRNFIYFYYSGGIQITIGVWIHFISHGLTKGDAQGNNNGLRYTRGNGCVSKMGLYMCRIILVQLYTSGSSNSVGMIGNTGSSVMAKKWPRRIAI